MKCPVLSGQGAYVDADGEDPSAKLKTLQDGGRSCVLAVRRPVPMELVYAASYSAANTLHMFTKATNARWAVPYAAAAGRCGIRCAVTFYPVVPGLVRCADVLEQLDALAFSRRALFTFMFPRIPVQAKATEDGFLVGGRAVRRSYIRQRAGSFFPSGEYIRRFMSKIRKYTDLTGHTCGVCGRDCRLCTQTEQD